MFGVIGVQLFKVSCHHNHCWWPWQDLWATMTFFLAVCTVWYDLAAASFLPTCMLLGVLTALDFLAEFERAKYNTAGFQLLFAASVFWRNSHEPQTSCILRYNRLAKLIPSLKLFKKSQAFVAGVVLNLSLTFDKFLLTTFLFHVQCEFLVYIFQFTPFNFCFCCPCCFFTANNINKAGARWALGYDFFDLWCVWPVAWPLTFAACGAVRYRGRQDHLQHNAGDLPAAIHVWGHWSAAFQSKIVSVQWINMICKSITCLPIS